MARMKMMLVLLGLVTVVCAAPQFTPSQSGSSGLPSFSIHGSNNSFEVDSSDRPVDNSRRRSEGSSLNTPIFGKPPITDDGKPSSSSSSYGGSSSFFSSVGKPLATEFNSSSSGAGVGASGSSTFGDSSDLSGSASDAHFSRSNPSPASGADAASSSTVSPSSIFSSVSSGSSRGFSSESASLTSIFPGLPGASSSVFLSAACFPVISFILNVLYLSPA